MNGVINTPWTTPHDVTSDTVKCFSKHRWSGPYIILHTYRYFIFVQKFNSLSFDCFWCVINIYCNFQKLFTVCKTFLLWPIFEFWVAPISLSSELLKWASLCSYLLQLFLCLISSEFLLSLWYHSTPISHAKSPGISHCAPCGFFSAVQHSGQNKISKFQCQLLKVLS